MKTRATIVAVVLVAVLAGCSSGSSDAKSGTTKPSNDKAIDLGEVAGAIDENEGPCRDLLASGAAFTANDVEVCRNAAFAAIFDCDNGNDLVEIELDGQKWAFTEGGAPVKLTEGFTTDDLEAPCLA